MDGVSGVHIVLHVLSSRCWHGICGDIKALLVSCMASASLVLGHGRNHSNDFHPPDWHSFYLALPKPSDSPHPTARNFTSRDEQRKRRPYHLVAIDRSKVAAVEGIFRLRQHENLVGFERPATLPDRQNAPAVCRYFGSRNRFSIDKNMGVRSGKRHCRTWRRQVSGARHLRANSRAMMHKVEPNRVAR